MSDLPKGWEIRSLTDVADGGLFSDGDWVESKDQDPDGGIRLTQLADVGVAQFRDRSNRWLRHDQAAALGCTFLEGGDILIARMPDPIGRACLVPENLGTAVTVVDVAIIRIKTTDVDARFAMWAINSPQFHTAVVAQQSGTTRKRISRKNLAALSIPVPPIEEQRGIVEILEDHLSRLDTATADVNGNKKKLDALRLSILSHAFFGKHDWHTERLADLLEISIGGVWGSELGSSDVDVHVLRVTEMKSEGRLVPSTAARRSISRRQLETRQLRGGDILLEKSGGGPTKPVGRVGLVTEFDGPSICSNFMQLMRPRADRILPRFLHLYLHTFYMRGGTEPMQKASTNIRNLKSSEYVELKVPVPDLATQRRVIDNIELLFEGITRLESEATAAISRAAALRRTLLEAAFTGSLTGRSKDRIKIEEVAGV